MVVGDVQAATEQPATGTVVLVDATTGRVRAHLGQAQPVDQSYAAGQGRVLWTHGCEQRSPTRPCTWRSRSATGGTTASYRLPRPAFPAVISPDGREVALLLERASPDLRFAAGHPIPPHDIAVLHLDTGRLEIVPGIEVPAKTGGPGLAFTADSRWLMITLNAGRKTRLLAWRPGLAQPYESKPIPGAAIGAPPVVVLPARATG